jgi:hypothetical protein
MFVLALPLHAQAIEEVIFNSDFEFGDQCATFSGLNDSIMMRTVHLSGNFLLNGRGFPVSEYDDGVFSLRDRVTGDEFVLGNSHDANYAVNVIPGRYDVMYSLETATAQPARSPRNIGAVVMEDIAIVASGNLDIDLTAYAISGDFLHNGAPFPASEYDDGRIFLAGELGGRVEVGDTKLQSFSDVVVLAGNYEVRYQAETTNTNIVPRNEWGFVGLYNVSGSVTGLQIDVESIALSGGFTHNGLAMPGDEYDDGNLYLETAAGDRVPLGNSHDGVYARRVTTGEYDVYWEVETPGDSVPFNQRARVDSNVNIAGGILNINLLSNAVSGGFTLNGGAFPDTLDNTGQIVLRDQVAGADSVLAYTSSGSYSQNILEGTYDIVYQHLQGSAVPQNKNAVLSEEVLIEVAGPMHVNVVARPFEASVYHNGVLFPADQQQLANILLRNLASGDRIFLGKTSQQNLSALVIPGTYDAYYSHLAGDQIPRNSMAKVLGNHVIEPFGEIVLDDGIDLYIKSILINGSLLLNDAPMPLSEYDDGLLRLQFEEDMLPLANTHDQAYQVRLLIKPEKSIYWVHFGVETAGDNIPINEDARVMCTQFVPLIF